MKNKRGILALFLTLMVFFGGVPVKAVEFMSSDNTSLLGELYKENSKKVYINNIEVERKMIKQHYVKRGTNPKYIVIHDTDNRDSGADVYTTQRYFNTTRREASAHYAVQDNAIVHMVEDTDTAWHCGDKPNPKIKNSNSIGIEINVHPESDFNVAMNNAIELTKHLMEKYNIPVENVVRHYDVTQKTCPRMMIEDDPTLWTKFKAELGDKEAQSKLSEVTEDSNSRVITRDIDLQDAPSWIYSPLAELKSGDFVEYVAEEGTWVKVKSGNYEGWVPAIYVESNVKSEEKSVIDVTTLSRTTDVASQSLGVLGKGERVKVYHTKDGWSHISYNGLFGYVPSDTLEK